MCSLMMISDMLSQQVGVVKSVLKKWFKINDIQLVHLLVLWYLVNHGLCFAKGTNWILVYYNDEGVVGIFHWHNPSGRTMALGSPQTLTAISIRNTSWRVKAAGAYGWQPYHLNVPTVSKSVSLNLLEHSRPVQACTGIA